jgi:hypothetical protein
MCATFVFPLPKKFYDTFWEPYIADSFFDKEAWRAYGTPHTTSQLSTLNSPLSMTR